MSTAQGFRVIGGGRPSSIILLWSVLLHWPLAAWIQAGGVDHGRRCWFRVMFRETRPRLAAEGVSPCVKEVRWRGLGPSSLCFMRFPPVGWTASVCHRRVLPRATRSVASPPGFGSSSIRGWTSLFRPVFPAPPPGSGLGVGVCANMFPVLARVRVHTRTGCLRRFPRISPSVCAPSALRGLLGADPRVTGMDRAWLCDASFPSVCGRRGRASLPLDFVHAVPFLPACRRLPVWFWFRPAAGSPLGCRRCVVPLLVAVVPVCACTCLCAVLFVAPLSTLLGDWLGGVAACGFGVVPFRVQCVIQKQRLGKMQAHRLVSSFGRQAKVDKPWFVGLSVRRWLGAPLSPTLG